MVLPQLVYFPNPNASKMDRLSTPSFVCRNPWALSPRSRRAPPTGNHIHVQLHNYFFRQSNVYGPK